MADVTIVDMATHRELSLGRYGLGDVHVYDRIEPRKGELLVIKDELYKVQEIIYGFQYQDEKPLLIKPMTLILVNRHVWSPAAKALVRKFLGGFTDGTTAVLQQPEAPSAA